MASQRRRNLGSNTLKLLGSWKVQPLWWSNTTSTQNPQTSAKIETRALTHLATWQRHSRVMRLSSQNANTRKTLAWLQMPHPQRVREGRRRGRGTPIPTSSAENILTKAWALWTLLCRSMGSRGAVLKVRPTRSLKRRKGPRHRSRKCPSLSASRSKEKQEIVWVLRGPRSCCLARNCYKRPRVWKRGAVQVTGDSWNQ